MQDFLVDGLGFTREAASAFVSEGGTADTVMRWTKETCPSKATWTRLSTRRSELKRIKMAEPLRAWAEKWKARDFLRRATARELKWTMHKNPYYPCYAYGVPFEACADLGVSCADPRIKAHAAVCDLIRKAPSSQVETGSGVAGRIKIDDLDPNQLKLAVEATPIDLRSHPLWGKDLTLTPRAELVQLAGIDGIAEFKRARNGLRYESPHYVKRGGDESFRKDLAMKIIEFTTSSS